MLKILTAQFRTARIQCYGGDQSIIERQIMVTSKRPGTGMNSGGE